jgi:ketosteroid isomerase-like protein
MATAATTIQSAADAERYARAWAACWEAKDVEAVLAHFATDARFTSPKAAASVGSATVTGIDAMRDYWQRAAGRIDSIRFEVDRALWDPARRELAIVYTSHINGVSTRAVEILRFGSDGHAVEGEAFYGAVR